MIEEINFPEKYVNNLFHLPFEKDSISYFEIGINSLATYVSVFKIKKQLFIRVWDTDLDNLVQGFDFLLDHNVYTLIKHHNYNSKYNVLVNNFFYDICENNYFLINGLKNYDFDYQDENFKLNKNKIIFD